MSIQLAKQPQPGKQGKLYPAYTNIFAVRQYPSKPIQHYDGKTFALPVLMLNSSSVSKIAVGQ